jgi:hypothetical protein
MVLVRHPLYVAVGVTVAVYGIAYGLVSGSSVAAAVATFPGGWLAAYGLLNGIALATDDGDRDGGDNSDDDGDEDSDGDGGSGDAVPLSRVVGRVPY